MSHNIVQEMIQEMGPHNPALNSQPGMPMNMQAGGPMPQGMMPQGPANYQDQAYGQMGPPQMIGPQPPPGYQYQQQPQQQSPQQRLTPEQIAYLNQEQEMQEMMDLENFGMDGEHKPLGDRAMDRAREAVFLAIAFVLLSLPQSTQLLQRLVPQLAGNFYYTLVSKGFLMALIYFIAKYFELV